MKKIKNEISSRKNKVVYKKKTPFFSEKEIIFRFDGYAKILRFTSRFQFVCLCIFAVLSTWIGYSYYIYNRSENIIDRKNMEIGETRDAYLNLMTEFMALNENITSVIGSVNNKNIDEENLKIYKSKIQVVEEKIKSIIDEKDWVDSIKLSEKTDLNAALLQRDIVISERDAYKDHLEELLRDVEEIKKAEHEVLKRVEEVAGKELSNIKGAITAINKPLRAQKLYYNPLANKKNHKGGPYIPSDIKVKDKKLLDKIGKVFTDLENLEYYNKVIEYVPIGKPVGRYWVSSPFGHRSDPFNKSAARHKGIDLAARTGNKIKSLGKGKVTRAYYSASYGNVIEIDHSNGFKTKYAHMHKMYVKTGDEIESGDSIGEVGSTGRSTGPHLHYEVIYRGRHVDPEVFMKIKI